jgi:hypothetical protein
VGSILFECIAGDLPFGRRPPMAYMERVLRESAPSLAQLAPECPEHVASAIQRALARDAARRFPTMRAFAEALLPCQPGGTDPSPGARTGQPREGWWRVLAKKLSR